MTDQNGAILEIGSTVVYVKEDKSNTDEAFYKAKTALVYTEVAEIGDSMLTLADGSVVNPMKVIIV